MNELSLFSGAGGGCLGSKLLGHRILGYVEYEPYCQEILKQRIADGILDAAPIFGDIRKFISYGYALAYQGMVDILTGGFPCQPFSVAGKGLGADDPRNMWPSTLECIRIIRPRYVFLENVPGLLADRYMGRIFGDLAESGYQFRWTCLGADDIGANHRRKRLWILGYSERHGLHGSKKFGSSQTITRKGRMQEFKGHGGSSTDVVNSEEVYVQGFDGGSRQGKSGGSGWWESEPDVGRVVTRCPARVDRLKALGNGQVPLQMARAFQILSKGLE